MRLTIFDQGDSLKAHIRKEKKTAPLKLGDGMLLQEKTAKFTKFVTQ